MVSKLCNFYIFNVKIIQTNVISRSISLKVSNFLQTFNVSLLFSIIILINSNIFAGIIGQDERVKKEASYYPSTAIAKLQFIKNGKKQFCTAPLIASNVAVTNAHCLKNAKSLRFLTHNEQVRISKLWVSKNHDFGFIFLNEPIGHKVGWFSLKNYHAKQVLNKNVINLEAHSNDMGFFEQKGHCSIKYVYNQAQFNGIGHDCDTLPGSSGAPLFIKQGEKAVLLGINSSSTSVGSCSIYHPGKCTNIGVKSSSIISALQKFKSI